MHQLSWRLTMMLYDSLCISLVILIQQRRVRRKSLERLNWMSLDSIVWRQNKRWTLQIQKLEFDISLKRLDFIVIVIFLFKALFPVAAACTFASAAWLLLLIIYFLWFFPFRYVLLQFYHHVFVYFLFL